MKCIKNARYILIGALLFSLITCNRNALVDSSDLNEIFIPAPGQEAFVSIPGRTLSNGIWNIWTLNNWFEEYFWEINNKCIDSNASHVYFDGEKMYFIFTLTSQERYLVEMDTYEYNRANGFFSLTNKYDSSFNTETGYLGYFNPDPGEGFGYELLHLQKANSFSGVVKNTTISEVIMRFAVLSHQYASNGDGVSAGSIQVNVNYSGSHPVSESNPIFIELYNLPNIHSNDSEYGGVITTKTGSTTITHLPDGNYFIIAYVKPSLLLNPDDEIRPGDSHLWYGNAYYSETGMMGSPQPVMITGGSSTSIAIDFNDAHPFTLKKEAWTTLNNVTASYTSNTITITVDIDMSQFGSGSIPNQNIFVNLNSPRSYSVKGVLEGEYYWQRGQSFGFSLTHQGGTIWQGNISIEDYLESGNWMVYGIYVSDNIDGSWGNGDDVRVSFEAQARGEITKNYVYTENNNYNEGQGPCKNNVPICYVNISTTTPDLTGPELLAISPDKTSITGIDMAVVKFTTTDSGSGLPTGWAGRVWLSQVGDYESFNNGVSFDIIYQSPDYQAVVMASALPSMGDWTIRHIMIRDKASNSSNYVLYDDPFWLGNPFGIDGTYYYLFNNEGLMPVKSSVPKVTITKY